VSGLRWLLLVLLGAVSQLGCSSDDPKKLSAGDYDQTCSENADCVIVDIGACECSCETAVINVKDKAKFDQDLSQCEPSGECGMCPWMNSAVAYCNAGHCERKTAGGTDAGADGG
jgi:hypothetical protein